MEFKRYSPEEIEEIRDAWCVISCGDCVHFSFKIGAEATCPMIDHEHIKFYHPYFKSYDNGEFMNLVCPKFEPNSIAKWLREHWCGVDAYYTDKEKTKGNMSFFVDGDEDAIYQVPVALWWRGEHMDSQGNLRWVLKTYMKRVRKSEKNSLGWVLLDERPDGTVYRHGTQEVWNG